MVCKCQVSRGAGGRVTRDVEKILNILSTRIQNYRVRFSGCQRFSSGVVSLGKRKFVCEAILIDETSILPFALTCRNRNIKIFKNHEVNPCST